MRLLVVSQYFWPENFRINDLVTELVKRGHEVTVLTGKPNYPEGKIYPEFRADPAQYNHYNGASVIRAPLISRGNGGLRLILNYLSFAISALFVGWWKLRKKDFDAIFVFETSPITVGIPAIALRALKKTPLAFWVLDLWPETLEAVGVVKSKLVLGWVGKLVSFIYDRCDVILAQSKSFIPQIEKYAKDKERIVYFPSWAETIFEMKGTEPAPEVPSKPNSFNVMFAGNIGEAQDFPAILAAAERLKKYDHIRWLIVGDGRMAAWVREEVRRRGLQDCFLMLGRYPVERMPSFYKHAQVLLVSLRDEAIFSMTIPGKLQSYLAAGIPVVAMLNGEGAEVVTSTRSGLACPAGDSEGLAEAVLKLSYCSPAELAELGQNAAETSVREFDRNTQISKLEQLLLQLRYRGRSAKNPPSEVFD